MKNITKTKRFTTQSKYLKLHLSNCTQPYNNGVAAILYVGAQKFWNTSVCTSIVYGKFVHPIKHWVFIIINCCLKYFINVEMFITVSV